MENFWIVAQQVAMLFILMGFGVFARQTKILGDVALKGLVNLLMLVVTPCLIIDVFQRPFDAGMLRELGIAFFIALSVHFASIAVVRHVFRKGAEDTSPVLKVATVFSNAGFMGIPLEQAILGETGVFYGTVYVVVFNLLMWSWGLRVMSRTKNGFNRMMLVNPGTVGIACGLVLFLLPWKLPVLIHDPIRMIAGMNTPLAMIAIGYYLAGAKLGAVLRSPKAYVACALRLVVCPLVLVGVLWFFRHALNRQMMLAVVIPAAAPVGAMVAMFASQYGRDVNMAVALVSGSTLVSIVTMPPVVALAMSVLH